jgi:hypothetical protein
MSGDDSASKEGSWFDKVFSSIDPTHGLPLAEKVDMRCMRNQRGFDLCKSNPGADCSHWEERVSEHVAL